MEVIPRLPMLSFDLKRSPDFVEFGSVLGRYIKNHYGEDPQLYTDTCYELEQLRQVATQVVCDYLGCTTLKKYYAQLQFLQGRFPMKEGEEAAIPFTWEDVQTGREHVGDIKFEQACILYNIGSLHSLLGVLDTRQNAEGMKVSCTHFQCAAWAFEHLRDNFGGSSMSTDMSFELLSFHILLMLAQAQECILEKSMLDGRKNNITAKVAAQVVDFYRRAITSIDGCEPKKQINSRMHKEWRRRMTVKMSLYQCITYYYQGKQTEEAAKHGECLAFFTGAKDKLAEAAKLGKNEVSEITDCLKYWQDVIVGKYNSAKKDNDFVYHDKVPALESLPEVKGASLVKGIPFNPNDKEISGPDIFRKLVPMEAHEASSVYSEEKAKLLRSVKDNIEEKDMELEQFMSSLQLDMEQLMPKPDVMPEHLMEKCAAMSVRTNAIQELTDSMASVSGLATEVELGINEIQELIDMDTTKTEQFEEQYGRKKPTKVLPGLLSDLTGYRERHKEGSQLNTTLHRAMNKHTTNLKTLTLPPSEILTLLPPSQPNLGPEDDAIVSDVRRLMMKVSEMKDQRKQFLEQLTVQLHSDDITNTIVTQDTSNKNELYAEQLKKHDQLVQHINMNMSAQEKILRSLTDANAKYALIRQAFARAVDERERTIKELILSYEKYEDLLAKSAKGSDYYKKLFDNVNKTLERCRNECRVRQEERDLLISTFAPKMSAPCRPSAPKPRTAGATPTTPNPVSMTPDLPTSHNIPTQSVDVTDPSGVQTVDPDVLNTFPSNLPAAFEGPKLKDYLPFMKPRSFGPKPQSPQPVSSDPPGIPLSPSVPPESPQPSDLKNLANILPASIAQYIASSMSPAASFANSTNQIPASQSLPGYNQYSTPTMATSQLPHSSGMRNNSLPSDNNLPYNAGSPKHQTRYNASGIQPTQNCNSPMPPPTQPYLQHHQLPQDPRSIAISSSSAPISHSGGYPQVPLVPTNPVMPHPVASARVAMNATLPNQQSTIPGQNMIRPPLPQNSGDPNLGCNTPPASSGSNLVTQGQYYPQQQQPHPHPQASYNIRPDTTNTVSASNRPVLSPGKAFTPATTPVPPPIQQLPFAAHQQQQMQHQFYHPQQQSQALPQQQQQHQQLPQYQQYTQNQQPVSGVSVPVATAQNTAASVTPSSCSDPRFQNYPYPKSQSPCSTQQQTQPQQPLPSLQTGSNNQTIPAYQQQHPLQLQQQPTPQGQYQQYQASQFPPHPHAQQQLPHQSLLNNQQMNTGYNIVPQSQPSQNVPQSQQTPYNNQNTAVKCGQYPGQNAHTSQQYVIDQNVSTSQQYIAGQNAPTSQHVAGQNILTSQYMAGQTVLTSQHYNNNVPQNSPTQYSSQSAQVNQQYPQCTPTMGQNTSIRPSYNIGQNISAGHNVPVNQQYPGQTQQLQSGITFSPHGSPVRSINTTNANNIPISVSSINATLPSSAAPHGGHQIPPQAFQQPQQNLYNQQLQYPHSQHQTYQQPSQQPVPPSQQPHLKQQQPPPQQGGWASTQVEGHPNVSVSVPTSNFPQVMTPQTSATKSIPICPHQQVPTPTTISTVQPVSQNPYLQQPGGVSYTQQGSVYQHHQYPQQKQQTSGDGRTTMQPTAGYNNNLPLSQQQQPSGVQVRPLHPTQSIYHNQQLPVQPQQQVLPPQQGQQQQVQQPQQGFYQQAHQQPQMPSTINNSDIQHGMFTTTTAMPQPLQPQTMIRPMTPSSTNISQQQQSTPQPQQQGMGQKAVGVPQIIVSTPSSSIPTPPMSVGRQNSSCLDDILSSSPNAASDSLPITPQVLTDQERQLEKEQAKKNLSQPIVASEPYGNQGALHKLLSDVESFGQLVDNLPLQILGVSRLDSIWKSLLDSQECNNKKQSIAIARCYPMMNRDPDIMPYDETRVVLSSTKDDYINASWLNDLAPSCPKFISTQAPLPQTCVDFWTMVYEQGTEVLVQITSEYETGKKFPVYYPTEREKPSEQGSLIISLQSIKYRQNWVERIVYLKNSVTKQGRTVVHLQFKGWPVSGFPDDVMTIVRFISEVHNFYKQQRSLTKPIIVHCGTGVGRTGVLVMVYAAIQELVHGNGLVDIPGLSKRMLHKRKGILLKKEQLFCAYQCLLCFAEDYLSKRGILVKTPHFSSSTATSSASKDDNTSRSKEGLNQPPPGQVVDNIVFGAVDLETIRANVGLLHVSSDKDKKQAATPSTPTEISSSSNAATTKSEITSGSSSGGNVGVSGGSLLSNLASMASLPDVVQQHSPETLKGGGGNGGSYDKQNSSGLIIAGGEQIKGVGNNDDDNNSSVSSMTVTTAGKTEKKGGEAANMKPTLVQLQDPSTFTMGSPEKSQPRITKANFGQGGGRLTNPAPDDASGPCDDPLANLDPLWSLGK